MCVCGQELASGIVIFSSPLVWQGEDGGEGHESLDNM